MMSTGEGSNSNVSKTSNKPKKAPELHSLDRRNWLIHLHYVRHETELCKSLIRLQLEETRGMAEYANYVQGLILRQEGKVQESLEMFQTCNILNPASVDHIKQMAKSLFLLGRHKLAAEAYKQAQTRLSCPDWEIHYYLGLCMMYLREFSEAKSELSQSLDASKQEQTFVALAKIHVFQDDIDAAIQVYRTAVTHWPENPDLSTSLGQLYSQKGLGALSFEQLGNGLTFDPMHTSALMAVGHIMQSHEDVEAAMSKYRMAAKVVPESAQLWNNIGTCLMNSRKNVAAIACFKRAHYLAPLDHRILYNLGLVHLRNEQYTSAFVFLSAAINLRPQRGQTLMLLAIALSRMEDSENALSSYRQALKQDSVDPAIALNMAVLCRKLEDVEESRTLLDLFEVRVRELRKMGSGMDADPDLLATAAKLADAVDHPLKVLTESSTRRMLIDKKEANKEAKPRQGRKASATVKAARADAKARLKAQGKQKHQAQEEEIQVTTSNTDNTTE